MCMMEMVKINDNFDLNVEIYINRYSEIKEAVKVLSEVQKEYNCNCVLNIKCSITPRK